MSPRYPSLLFLLTLQLPAPANAEPLDFNLDVRPLLSDRCFKCHGFDKNTRESELRLDVPEGAFADRDGGQAIVPGNPEESLVWQRITSADPDDVMPPPDSHLKLNENEKQLIRQWIAEGAEYKKHWALIAPERPEIPKPVNATIHNPIDAFIAHRLLRPHIRRRGARDIGSGFHHRIQMLTKSTANAIQIQR